MSAFNLRKAIAIDLGHIKYMQRLVIGKNGCTWDENYPSDTIRYNDCAAECLYVLAEKYNTIGAVSVVPENELDDIECWEVKDGTQREIARLVIMPEYQGKGYSKVMLSQLFSLLAKEGCHAVHLLVAKSNEPAVNLYKSLGFNFLGECFRYENNFYICEKKLSPQK